MSKSINTGNRNTGDLNTGNRNTGDLNTGNWNTGNRNTGNRNTGNWNTGNLNTGNRNTGNWNTGDLNTGDLNTGNWNTGDLNTGNRNTGNRNTGNWNTGNLNTGNLNTGNWNQCNYETGFFNTAQSNTVRIFNKEYSREEWDELDKPSFLYFNPTEWINESDMSDEEREANPSHKVTGGYLKKYEYKEAFEKSWNEASKEDQQKVLTLPNFDAEIFKQISGIDVNNDKADKIQELAKSHQELLDKANEIQKQIEGLK